jgi:hypothetical protein
MKARHTTRRVRPMFLVKQRDRRLLSYGRAVWCRELVLRRSPVHKVRMKPCERQALP